MKLLARMLLKLQKYLELHLPVGPMAPHHLLNLAGFPYHALDTYLHKLVRAGQRVAICEQLEDPKLTKKIVKRGITELITPGVSLNDNVLEHQRK